RGLVAVLAALVETFTGEAPVGVPVVAEAGHVRVGDVDAGALHARVEIDSVVGGASLGAGVEECAESPAEAGPAFEVVSLLADAGATTVLARPGEPPASGELVDAVRRAHAREVVLLPNDADLRHTAAAAAEQARAEGIRVALIPTRSAVQGIAALAVHEPERRF